MKTHNLKKELATAQERTVRLEEDQNRRTKLEREYLQRDTDDTNTDALEQLIDELDGASVIINDALEQHQFQLSELRKFRCKDHADIEPDCLGCVQDALKFAQRQYNDDEEKLSEIVRAALEMLHAAGHDHRGSELDPDKLTVACSKLKSALNLYMHFDAMNPSASFPPKPPK